MKNHLYTELTQYHCKILSPYFMKWNTADDFEPIVYLPCSGFFGSGVTSLSILLKLFSFYFSFIVYSWNILHTFKVSHLRKSPENSIILYFLQHTFQFNIF